MVPQGVSTAPIKVLNDGFVRLVDVMGDESSIVQAARVSYGEGTKHVSEDRTLIRYLMRHRHSTPLEMVELKFHVRVPMDCWRQWIRHRTASVNEYSTRYSEAIDSRQTTEHDDWRLQSGANKQGSAGHVQLYPEGLEPTQPSEDHYIARVSGMKAGEYLSQKEQQLHRLSQTVYDTRLSFGVAREQARKDLPLSTYTEAYWKIDLHNLLHFLSLRMDSHAQHEIRMYANVIGTIVEELFPNVWEAFLDYRMGAIQLTRLDLLVIQAATSVQADSQTPLEEAREKTEQAIEAAIAHRFDNKREADECRLKLRRLGILG